MGIEQGRRFANRHLSRVTAIKYKRLRITIHLSRIKFCKDIFLTIKAFNRKISFFTSKLNIELRGKMVGCSIWSTVIYGSETRTLRKLKRNYLKCFEIWCWKRIEKIKWAQALSNEEVLEHIAEKKTFLYNIQRKKADLNGHCKNKLSSSCCQ